MGSTSVGLEAEAGERGNPGPESLSGFLWEMPGGVGKTLGQHLRSGWFE